MGQSGCNAFKGLGDAFEFGAWKRDYGLYPRGEQIREWYKQILDVAKEVGTSKLAVTSTVRRSVASHVVQMLRVEMFDETVALADVFHTDGGWPNGWIGVRRTMRRYKDKMAAPLLARLTKLEERMRPNDLAGLIRSYALSPEWGALDIAELEEDEEDKPLQAREKVMEVCNDLGQQLVKAPAQFAAMLPEILTSESQKTSALGRGFAAGCTSLQDCWKQLKDTFLVLPKERRQAQTLAGFMMSARAIAPEETEEFFDAAIADPELHPYLIYWLIWAGGNPRDFERLTKAIELDTVPVWTFSHLAGGRAHETLNDEQFDKFIQSLTARPDGSVIAAEILGMRIFGLRSDQQPVSDQIKATARNFLRQLQFEHKSSRLGHMLGEIVAVSFGKPEHEAEVREFCNRILEAIKAYKIHVMDIGDVIRELTKAHPISVFDILVEQAAEDEDIGHTLFEDMWSNQASPLDSVPPDVWLGWAAAKPETRFIYLVQVIRFSQGNDDDASTGWSPAAEQLINTAPDPAKVLDVFMSRFEPTSGWAGSFANTMASRVPMIEALTQHPRAEVAAWATENIAKFSDRVARMRESEAARNRSEHEAFE